MRIAIGADHAGFVLKTAISAHLRQAGHEVTDAGTHNTESCDYPDFASAVAQDVADGSADRGILVCYTGVGMSIAANKINGVRAVLAVNEEEIELSRRHNNSNVLTLGAKYIQPDMANEYVRRFLETEFEGGRHQRRVDKISQLERNT